MDREKNQRMSNDPEEYSEVEQDNNKKTSEERDTEYFSEIGERMGRDKESDQIEEKSEIDEGFKKDEDFHEQG